MLDVFMVLILLALVGGGFLVVRRLLTTRQPMYPTMEVPWQNPYGPKDD
jgi:hypothetical protein